MEGRLGALAKEKKASHVRNPYRKVNNLERPDKVLFSTCTGCCFLWLSVESTPFQDRSFRTGNFNE
jgi:hypothetical protein